MIRVAYVTLNVGEQQVYRDPSGQWWGLLWENDGTLSWVVSDCAPVWQGMYSWNGYYEALGQLSGEDATALWAVFQACPVVSKPLA